MKKLLVLSMFLFLVTFAVGAQAYNVTVTNDLDQMIYVGGSPLLTENFEDLVMMPGFSIIEVNGTGTITTGRYTNIVDKDVPRYQIFQYLPGMTSFGGFLNLASVYGAGGPGSELDMFVNNSGTWEFVQTVPNTAKGEFYGFVTDGAFTQVKFADHGSTSGIQETYYSIDMSLHPTPIPGALLLLGPGLIGLAGIRRRMSR
jgi:hypothetical protein